ncbi:hypothetical protein ABEB36_010667 [Hypothenemus hampei]|uniref:Uncharacterized protein n=1 Tax=Hypothenemus hampei TaxID=57062 RepID=A0ABD1EDB5_HYPHA
MENNDLKDISQIESSIRKDPSFKITEVVWLQITKDDPTIICASESHNILHLPKQYSMLKKMKGVRNRYLPPVTVNLQSLPKLYNFVLPIKKEKKANLLDMCKFIPLEYREFYYNLPSKV